MHRSLVAVLAGTFTLRFSTGLTGALLVYYLADFPRHGGNAVDPLIVGMLSATFFLAELLLSPPFGAISDRLGQHPVMQAGPGFGAVAVILTGLTTSVPVLALTRLLEGGSTAASVPSILGYVARATAHDDALRGRAVARFELATLAGLGAGLVAAGPLYELVGRTAFFLNAVVYGLSWLIYRFGVEELEEGAGSATDEPAAAPDPRDPPAAIDGPAAGDAPAAADAPSGHGGAAPARAPMRRYVQVLGSSHVWLLAPTWIALNASIGLWTSQSLFQLVQPTTRPVARHQMLMGGFTPTQVSIGLAVGMLVFFAGLLYWGGRFRTLRRTTIILYGIAGGAIATGSTFIVNHSGGQPVVITVLFTLAAGFGLFVLAGATPAALGLLADVSEVHPQDRGVIMGLYSVFLALGQVIGSLVGGESARLLGIDGLLAATILLLGVAVVPLWRLRPYEHRIRGPGGGARGGPHAGSGGRDGGGVALNLQSGA